MSDWIVVDLQNLPEFEKEIELVSCDPNTGKQSSHFGYLSLIDKSGPHFKKKSGGEILHVTHWKEKTKLPKKIKLDSRKRYE